MHFNGAEEMFGCQLKSLGVSLFESAYHRIWLNPLFIVPLMLLINDIHILAILASICSHTYV